MSNATPYAAPAEPLSLRESELLSRRMLREKLGDAPPPRATCPPGTPCANGLTFQPVPGQRAFSARRKRPAPAPDDADLLALGQQWQASAARERALDDALDAIEDIHSPAYAATRDAALKEAEVGAGLRCRIVQLRAKTGPGVLLKIAVVNWAYDVRDEDVADELKEDPSALGSALTMSLCRDLRSWFHPGPDAALLQLGEALEIAWQAEADAWAAYQGKGRGDLGGRWDAANEATKAIVQKIDQLPATTVAGLVVKARACSWTHDGEPFEAGFFDGDGSMDHRLAASVLRDLIKLDGRPLPTGSAASCAA